MKYPERLGETSECLCVRKQSGTATQDRKSLFLVLSANLRSNGFSKSSANSTEADEINKMGWSGWLGFGGQHTYPFYIFWPRPECKPKTTDAYTNWCLGKEGRLAEKPGCDGVQKSPRCPIHIRCILPRGYEDAKGHFMV